MGWTRFLKRRFWDGERSCELESYIEIETEDNIARGMRPDEARQAAYRKLGNPVSIREEIYQMNSVELLDSTWRDLKYSARQLRLSPAFAVVAVVSLALGIGANTAIFQLLDAVRLRSLPVQHPQQLAEVRIVGGNGGFGINGGAYAQLTYPLWEQIRTHQQAFSRSFAWSLDTIPVGRGAEARNLSVLQASGDLFPALGVLPVRGRLFNTQDDQTGCSPRVVISYGLWQSRFGGRDSAIGSKLYIDDQPIEVIGVTPPSFSGLVVGSRFDIAAPLCIARNDRRDVFWLTVMGRLKPGWSIAKASAELGAISPGLFEATAITGYSADIVKRYKTFRLAAYPAANGVSALRGKYDTSLWMLLGITGLVLLIACANLANLLLARASVREREVAVRLALGSSRARLIRFLLSESLLLAVAGSVIGAGLAQLLSRAIISFLSVQDDSLVLDLSTGWRVLAFSAALTAITCCVFGLAPAVRASGVDPGSAMKAGGRGTTAGRERFSFQRILMAGQIAISLVLLVGALLFVQSFRNLVTLDPGFREKGIVLGFVSYGNLHLPAARLPSFEQQLLERVQAAPGVESAALSTNLPLTGQSWTSGVILGNLKSWSKATWVSPEYFETLGIPLLAGRGLLTSDTAVSQHVAVVNQTFVRKLLGGANPIGRAIRTLEEPDYPATEYRIVGVVKDARYSDLREEAPQQFYAPAPQNPHIRPWTFAFIRSNAPDGQVIADVKQALAGLSPDITNGLHGFERQVQDDLTREHLMAALSGFFGLLAATLAAIGLYGVISYLVARRRNEIGVRIALGASRTQVIRMVMRDAAQLLIVGVIVGVAVALLAGKSANAMLFGLKAWDPLTFIGASGSSPRLPRLRVLYQRGVRREWMPLRRCGGNRSFLPIHNVLSRVMGRSRTRFPVAL